ncbi:hypothetical protein BDW74DRAFT_177359 [Aspergillus multicolor]|uniref:serine hydrolase domain-containing protein n=1 Tax=Aspergillus multicolor TaxID=41759 RepID=UPI003CCCC11D
MSRPLSATAAAAARTAIYQRTSGPSPEIPGLVYCAVNKQGESIFNHASGNTALGGTAPMTLDTTFWLASCTKLITAIAAMQLVERGKLALDDSDQLELFAPELRDVQVLERTSAGGFQLVPKERRITLRMLLTHTGTSVPKYTRSKTADYFEAGFGYAFEDAKLRGWSLPIGLDDFLGHRSDILHRPLVNQPGTKFQYGTGMDWAGAVVERVAGMSLEAYFQTFIFGPLGIKNMRFFPTPDMRGTLATMHQRDKDGVLRTRDHLLRLPLLPCAARADEDRFCMGGCGCFGTPLEYCRILAAILNDGCSPHTGAKILKSETVKEMFTDQIPTMPIKVNEYTPTGKPEIANPTPLMPGPEDLTEGWGLSFSLSHVQSPTGRAAGSASWEGVANLFWFADRENGIGGIIASQILPYGDLEVVKCSGEVERIIYDDLVRR